MTIEKLIKELEFEGNIEFPFENENISVYDIEETSSDILLEKMYYYKYLSILTFCKEHLEAYLSYYKKLNNKTSLV